MKEVMNYKQKQLVTAHLSLVPRMVRSLTRSFTYLSQDEFDELTQTGYLALCNAAMNAAPHSHSHPMQGQQSEMRFTITGETAENGKMLSAHWMHSLLLRMAVPMNRNLCFKKQTHCPLNRLCSWRNLLLT